MVGVLELLEDDVTCYVAQPNGYGCSIACVAMVVGKTYEEMEAWFVESGMPINGMAKGLHSGVYFEALHRHGFAIQQRYKYDTIAGTSHLAWPPKPFAPLHIAATRVAAGSHAIVLLGDGRVLDPFNRERDSLTHPDYHAVDFVAGIWRVAP